MSVELLFQGEAEHVWRHFAALSAVPRPSKREAKVRAYLIDLALSKGIEYREDKIGNIVYVLPGKGNLSAADTVILQGHMDMVCEKNADKIHDFDNDGIALCVKDDWLCADGTTLGADNGIAIAMALALLEENLENMIPLEFLFTVDEETGLTGALELDPAILNGRQVLNLDSEEDGVFTIGCAGGIDLTTHFKAVDCEQESAYEIAVSGLRGGHSGVNIHENRGNAIRILCEVLDAFNDEQLKLFSLKGGNKKNAIPREASALISSVDELHISAIIESVKLKWQDSEPDLVIDCRKQNGASSHYPGVINFINAMPNGVISYDPAYPELVQSSNSIGVVIDVNGTLQVLAHGRSSSSEDLDKLVERCAKYAADFGGEFEDSERYPGWQPNAGSALLKHAQSVYQSVFNELPRVESIHAGLETGIIGDKIGSEELLSYGPTIINAHSPEESLSISSLNNVYKFLKAFVTSGV